MSARAEHPALVAAARHGLGEPTATVALPAVDTDDVLARARHDRLLGFLAGAVLDGVVVAPDDAFATLRAGWQEELHHSVRLEALAVRTAAVLDAAGVTWRLTKGPALAHLDYPDPAVRTFGDVDVVVHPSDWTHAFEVLTRHGLRRHATTLPAGYDDRFGKGATLRSPDHLELDLHRRFAVGRFAVRSEMSDVFTSADRITLADRPIPTLDATGRLLHACFHALLGRGARLRAFRDIAQLLLVTGADWRSAFAVARSWRAEAVVAVAVAETWRRLELQVDHPAHARAVATTVTRGDRRVLQRFAEGADFRAQALSALPRLPAYDVPRYLWALSGPHRHRGR